MGKPLLIGITGGIGTGKSIISKVFALLNVPVYDADSRAKFLLNNDLDLKSQIILLLGEEAYIAESYNNVWVASKVFSNPTLLTELNSLVHPAVAKDFKKWSHSHKNAPFLLKEAALLIETGSYKGLDGLILVQSPKELRIRHILSRDSHRTIKQIESILDKQMSESQKAEYATDFILNDEKTLVLPQVMSIFHKYFAKSI